MNPASPAIVAWKLQRNVVFALFIRELKARFGHFRLGYLWAVGEPVAMVAVLSAIRLALGNADIAGVPYPLFFASAIIPFFFFQTTVNQCLLAVENNIPLLNYRIVKPADPVIARCLLELFIYTATGFLIIGGLVCLGFTFRWNDTLGVIAVMSCLGAFTLGLSLLVAVSGALMHDSKKVVPILIRPFFFISGIFFAASSLPSGIRELLLWNPLLHVSELIREYMFADYQSHEGSLGFLFTTSLASLFLGLATYRTNRIRLTTSGQIR